MNRPALHPVHFVVLFALLFVFCSTSLTAQEEEQPQAPTGMVYIPGGSFVMGSDDGNPINGPKHMVVTEPFFIDRTEVTIAAYDECVKAGECKRNKEAENPNFFESDLPMVQVSWVEASEYCAWAGKRLPTEAEWEKAARGEDGRDFPWGRHSPIGRANYVDAPLFSRGDKVYRFTHPVCSHPSGNSPYGLCDMGGNVAEWTADIFDPDHHTRRPGDPLPVGQRRTVRGGGFFSDVPTLRTYTRDGNRHLLSRGYVLGFRCAKDAK